ncbi:MFS transporter [Sphaerisporangium rubeum]|uniref:MFS family permease n=1 Tax=Sphaerisporangium rubeum TaxID=321317 RepID=A0A7X0M814_9ACTN|nr:MFS family permease [Sphaerisporangium rubeum]
MSAHTDRTDGHETPEDRSPPRPVSDRAVVATLAATGLVSAFMMTLVTPLVPELPAILGARPSDVQWVLTVTLLAAAVSTPIAGRLGDLYGKKRVVLILLGLVGLGSVIAMFSSSLIPLVVARALQGTGIGVIPVGLSILRDTLHRDRLSGGIALVSATLGVGGAVGLPLSAYIAQYLDWHLLFVMSGLLSVAGALLVWRVVPSGGPRDHGSFDLIGALGLAAGLVALLLGVSEGNTWGWTSPATLGCLIGGVVVFAIWGLYELRVPSPLIDLRVAARRPVLFTNIASITVGFGFFGTVVMFPQILESPTGTGVGLGQNMLVAGLCLMPCGLVMWATSPFAARLTRSRGPRVPLLIGIILIGVTYAVSLVLMTEVWHMILTSVLIGFGVGFAYAAMPNLIMSAVPASETAASNGLNAVMRTFGSTVASAVLGAVMAAHTVTSGTVTTTSAAGFRVTFVISAAVTVVGAVFTLLIPRHRPPYRDASVPDAGEVPSAAPVRPAARAALVTFSPRRAGTGHRGRHATARQ